MQKSQLTIEQPLTRLEPTKKDILHVKTKKPQQTVGWVQTQYNQIPYLPGGNP